MSSSICKERCEGVLASLISTVFSLILLHVYYNILRARDRVFSERDDISYILLIQ